MTLFEQIINKVNEETNKKISIQVIKDRVGVKLYNRISKVRDTSKQIKLKKGKKV